MNNKVHTFHVFEEISKVVNLSEIVRSSYYLFSSLTHTRKAIIDSLRTNEKRY